MPNSGTHTTKKRPCTLPIVLSSAHVRRMCYRYQPAGIVSVTEV